VICIYDITYHLHVKSKIILALWTCKCVSEGCLSPLWSSNRGHDRLQ